ncbi:hypothetical protein LIER_15536 [Lithospermum erythrorhizon]|uniref:Uncharacterized protein n=1 Tax=Lithospermum erythrorhizon TaxID=34254 RepID=A0AAV3Q7X6_LITER
MARRHTQKGQTPIRGGVVERTLDKDLAFEERLDENPRFEVEEFVANVLTEPPVDAASIKTPLLKRKVSRDEGPKRKPKKSKKAQSAVPVEGAEGAMVNDPGVKDSQTLKGFRDLFDDIPDDEDMGAEMKIVRPPKMVKAFE